MRSMRGPYKLWDGSLASFLPCEHGRKEASLGKKFDGTKNRPQVSVIAAAS